MKNIITSLKTAEAEVNKEHPNGKVVYENLQEAHAEIKKILKKILPREIEDLIKLEQFLTSLEGDAVSFIYKKKGLNLLKNKIRLAENLDKKIKVESISMLKLE